MIAGPLLLDTPAYPFEIGAPVQCCIRPEHVLILRPGYRTDHYTNIVQGRVVSIVTDGLSYTLRLCLLGERLGPDRPYDLTVVLPLHVYESLAPKIGQVWPVSLKKNAIHLMEFNRSGL